MKLKLKGNFQTLFVSGLTWSLISITQKHFGGWPPHDHVKKTQSYLASKHGHHYCLLLKLVLRERERERGGESLGNQFRVESLLIFIMKFVIHNKNPWTFQAWKKLFWIWWHGLWCKSWNLVSKVIYVLHDAIWKNYKKKVKNTYKWENRLFNSIYYLSWIRCTPRHSLQRHQWITPNAPFIFFSFFNFFWLSIVNGN